MHLRADHAERDIPTLRQFIRDNPLGILITGIPSDKYPTLQCSHIPWILDDTSTELGKLRGHMARANPHAKAIIESLSATGKNGTLEQEMTVLFNGPAHHYVTPKFYVETKPSTGKVVPTWNYSAAQVYGRMRVYFDTKDEETDKFLQKAVEDLTKQSEEDIIRHDVPWEVSESPVSYVELLKNAIIGVEVEITRLEGKYKMSQEMAKGDREGVIKGFREMGTKIGLEIAKTVEERGAMKDAKKAAS